MNARDLFEAYTASTGGKTWDGKDVPPYEVIAERTPHVAKAWEAVAVRVADAIDACLVTDDVALLRASLTVMVRRLRGDESTALESGDETVHVDAQTAKDFARSLA